MVTPLSPVPEAQEIEPIPTTPGDGLMTWDVGKSQISSIPFHKLENHGAYGPPDSGEITPLVHAHVGRSCFQIQGHFGKMGFSNCWTPNCFVVTILWYE